MGRQEEERDRGVAIERTTKKFFAQTCHHTVAPGKEFHRREHHQEILRTDVVDSVASNNWRLFAGSRFSSFYDNDMLLGMFSNSRVHRSVTTVSLSFCGDSVLVHFDTVYVSCRERTRRITNEHARAEALVNNSLGTLGRCAREVAAAKHSLTCGVPDRESDEIKYLREATELIEAWQHQLPSGQPMSGPPSEHSEVILVERQR